VTEGGPVARAASPRTPRRRRGPRPAGADTRAEILAAARSEFAAKGYDATTLRGIARLAGVDPRLVHHYFEGKDEVFVAAVEFPAVPRTLVARVVDPGLDGIGERMARSFFDVWDNPVGRERLMALIVSVLSGPGAARMVREFLTREVFVRVAAATGAQDAQLRANLAASHMVGLAIARYVLQVEPLASTDTETLVELVAPALQRYLVGPLP